MLTVGGVLAVGAVVAALVVRQRAGERQRATVVAPTAPPVAPGRVPIALGPPVAPPVPPAARPVSAAQPLPPDAGPARDATTGDDPAALQARRELSEREALAARRRMDRLYEQETRRQALQRVAITVYLTSWCPACKAARRWLHENHIAYREVDVDHSAAADLELRAINPKRTIPTFNIEGTVLVGFSPRDIRAAIAQAARRHATAL